MKTLKWTGARGNEIELRAKCKIELVNKVANLDGHTFETDQQEQKIDAVLELWVDGKKVDSCWDINFWQTIDLDNGMKKIWGLNIGMTPEQAEIVDRFLQGVIESGKVEEAKALESEQQEAKLEERKLEAQMIIEKASKQSKVMTKAEYDQWRERYNRVANEGEEGHIPEMITTEQLEWARKVLSDS